MFSVSSVIECHTNIMLYSIIEKYVRVVRKVQLFFYAERGELDDML